MLLTIPIIQMTVKERYLEAELTSVRKVFEEGLDFPIFVSWRMSICYPVQKSGPAIIPRTPQVNVLLTVSKVFSCHGQDLTLIHSFTTLFKPWKNILLIFSFS